MLVYYNIVKSQSRLQDHRPESTVSAILTRGRRNVKKLFSQTYKGSKYRLFVDEKYQDWFGRLRMRFF